MRVHPGDQVRGHQTLEDRDTADGPPGHDQGGAAAEHRPITAADNAGLKQLTTQYEAAHSSVTVQWLPNNTGSISAANAAVESQASGGAAPDVVWEQYGPVTSGALPGGLLQNIKPYLTKPNPYVPGNSSWLSLFTPVTVPYMTSSNGDIDIILGSNVETGFFYSKAAFARAGIASPPATRADFMTDLGKLKSAGITPLMFTDGNANCTPSWWERLATTSLLASQVASQWQSLLTSAAQQWATQNHVDLNKY